MAYPSKAKGEHPYKKIQREVKEESLKNLLFFYGKETYLIQWAMELIVSRYIDPVCRPLDLTVLSGEDVSFSDLMSCCETLPVMSRYKVVIVADFKPLSGGKRKGFGEQEEKDLADYLKAVPESCLLIFTGEAPDKRKKLYKAVEAWGAAYDFGQLDQRLLTGFIEKRIHSRGKTVSPAVTAMLIAESGYYDKDTEYTLYHLINDIEKAVAHSQGQEIQREDVACTISGNIDTNLFAMIDALSQGKHDEAFRLLHNLMLSGEKEYRLLALICSQFESVLSAREMKEEGRSFEEIRSQLNMHEFRVKKAIQFAQRYSVDQLKNVVLKVYQVDEQIKSGLLPASLALELLLAQI